MCGNSCAHVTNRVIGGLTGSRVAGELGRIPVQVSLRTCLDALRRHSFRHSDVRLTAMSFVDNLFLPEEARGVHARRLTWSSTLYKEIGAKR